MSQITYAIADDHALFREGMKSILEPFDGLRNVFEAENGQELLDKLKIEQPDVVLLDLKMPVMDGIEAADHLRKEYPELKVIALTMFDEERMIAYMMEKGIHGYLLKDSSGEEVYNAIKSVIDKGYYFNEYVSKAVLSGLRQKRQRKPELSHNVTLTRREQEVLQLICEEMTTMEIAEKLFISDRTVEGHRKNLMEKLEVKNTAGLVVKAMRGGYVNL